MSNYFFEASVTLYTVRDFLRFAVSRFNQSKLFSGTAAKMPMTRPPI